MPGQSGLPPYRTKAPIHRPHHVSPAAPESQGTEPDRRLSPGAERPPYRRRGHLCISGQTGLGQIPPARIVESGLRGIYGRPGPQRAQGRATVAPRHGTSGSIETQGSSSRSSGNPKYLWRPNHNRRASTLQVCWIPNDERRDLFVAPCPSVGTHFFNKPLAEQS